MGKFLVVRGKLIVAKGKFTIAKGNLSVAKVRSARCYAWTRVISKQLL